MQGFETERLSVAPLAADERLADALPSLVTPEVTAHLPPDLHATAHPDAQGWLMRLKAGSDVYTIADGSGVIGLLTLHHASATKIMLGYLFATSVWGKGYATEMVVGLIIELRSSEWHGQVLGGVDPGNPASARVLEKAGFADVGDNFFECAI